MDPRKQLGISPIANPLAGEKLSGKCLKLVKKATKTKHTRRGVKEVVKALRKNEKGVCIIAGNVSPIDVISHLPVLCEEADVTYVFVPSKEELGLACQTKRPTSVILVTNGGEHGPLLAKVDKAAKLMTDPALRSSVDIPAPAATRPAPTEEAAPKKKKQKS